MWICSECGVPIKPRQEGYISIINIDKSIAPYGSYPFWSCEQAKQDKQDKQDKQKGQVKHSKYLDLDLDNIPKKTIAFKAYHLKCDPYKHLHSYYFSIDEAQSAQDWMNWIEHLTEKEWMGFVEIKDMCIFFKENFKKNIISFL